MRGAVIYTDKCVVDENGNSLLHVAVAYSALETLKWLLSEKVSPPQLCFVFAVQCPVVT